jgi:hypothetical protein
MIRYLGALVDNINANALPKVNDTQAAWKTGLTIFFGVMGAIAFLMMVIAGMNFVLSEGNPDKVARARNTIIYAGVGLAVAFAAAFAVTIVLGRTG